MNKKYNYLIKTIRKYSILLFTISPLFLYTQSALKYSTVNIDSAKLIATYSLKFVEDSLNNEFVKQEDMLLLIGNNVCWFISKTLYPNIEKLKAIENDFQFQQFLMNTIDESSIPKIRNNIYLNYPSGKLTFTQNILSSTFKYEEDMNLFNWKLTEDVDTITGYKVQKALCDFGGRSWVAWFTKEIPLNIGPYKFNGLPGLILKISDTQNHYVFEFISISKPEKETMIEIQQCDYVECTKLEFFKAEDGFRYDIINRAKEAGLNNKSQQTAARNMAKRNNPIELKRK